MGMDAYCYDGAVYIQIMDFGTNQLEFIFIMGPNAVRGSYWGVLGLPNLLHFLAMG